MPRVLNLGCGFAPLEGATNHDLSKHSPHVDIAHDLDSMPWPWADGVFDRIVAADVFEHLKSEVSEWLDECHRILAAGGALEIRVPHYRHENAFTDPTHRRFFTQHTFDYWDRSTVLHQKYGAFYFAAAGRWWRIVRNVTDEVNIIFTLLKEA